MCSHKKTADIEEHRDYLYKIVRLKFFFMHSWLEAHPEDSAQNVLRNRIDIYRKTDANPDWLNPPLIDWKNSAWQILEKDVLEAYVRYKDDIMAFEEEAFSVVKESIDGRLERDFKDDSVLKRYHCGAFRHDIYETDTNIAEFHIANPLRPYSIFDDPLYIPCSFLILMDHVQARYRAESIATASWLNSHPAWLNYFPEEWQSNMEPEIEDIGWGYGIWGQFINARGTFNDKLGDYFRLHRRFRYYPRYSKVSIPLMRQYLIDNFFSNSQNMKVKGF